jgi:hypothetical protein
MKTYGGADYNSTILDFGTRWRLSGQLHVPASFLQGNESPVVGWAPDPVWMLWNIEKSPALAGTESGSSST